jgi:nucleoside-triphosphatase THEP1
MNTSNEIRAAAVVYWPNEHDRDALAVFARELAASGYRIGGVVQEVFVDDRGRRTHIDSVDLATGERVTINQGGGTNPDGADCTLDIAALTDAGTPLRRALIDRPDLVVIEKFGEQEQSGGGLMDDVLAIIAEGLPTLVLVPGSALDRWRAITGSEIVEVPCEENALQRWWRNSLVEIS